MNQETEVANKGVDTENVVHLHNGVSGKFFDC